MFKDKNNREFVSFCHGVWDKELHCEESSLRDLHSDVQINN